METSEPPFDPARHRRGGRPKIPDEERRDLLVPVRMSPHEREHARTKATTAGMSLSEFARQAFEGAVEIVTTQEAPPELVRELRLLNHQMNHILREARRHPDTMAPELQDAAIDAMNTVSAELRIILHDPQP